MIASKGWRQTGLRGSAPTRPVDRIDTSCSRGTMCGERVGLTLRVERHDVVELFSIDLDAEEARDLVKALNARLAWLDAAREEEARDPGRARYLPASQLPDGRTVRMEERS